MTEERRHPEKKKRLQNACDECRRRKIRCDSETMPHNLCTSCLNLGLVCTHRKTQMKRGPKPGSMRTVASRTVGTLVGDILEGTSTHPFEVPEDKEVTLKILIKLANRIQELEKQLKDVPHVLQSSSKDSPSSDITPSPSTQTHESTKLDDLSEESDGVDELSKQISQFQFGLPKHTHFGESSNLMLMMDAMKLRKDLHGSNLPDWTSIFSRVKRPEFWEVIPWPSWYSSLGPSPALEFPPQPLLQELVESYFAEHNTYNPLLHRPTFEKSISEGLHLRDESFGALLLAVCSLGAHLLSSSPNKERPGDRWFCQIRLERFVFSPKLELYHLQLYCLCNFYFHSITLGVEFGWLLVGIAIRRSQEKGAHRRYTTESEQPTIQGELWKRVFWMLIVIDSRMSTLFGRPRATSIQDSDLGPLVECDDEYWEPEDPAQAFIQPVGKPSMVAYWNSYLKLTEIYSFAQLTIYSVRNSELGATMGIGKIEWYERAVMELSSALKKWVDSVPEHLRWENQRDDCVFFSQSAILYSLYHWTRIQVHRMFIPRPGQSSGLSSFDSLEVCLNAARECIRVQEIHCATRSFLYPHSLISLFNSAMILALNLVRSTQQQHDFDPKKEMADIYKCIELMRLYEAKYRLAGRHIDSINAVMYASHYPPRLVPASTPTDMASSSEPNRQNQTQTANMNSPFYSNEVEGSGLDTSQDDSVTSFSSPSGLAQEQYSMSSNFGDSIASALGPNLGSMTTSHESQYPAFLNSTGFTDSPGNFIVSGMHTPEVWHPLSGETQQDWDSFMVGVDQLLNPGPYMAELRRVVNNDFDSVNF
ncbi:Gypsy retrotransposon integrase-like protein 1 [Stygiomarasmius scandens]|uniref:Gypsy retrotransposon integrase-like protein 1 n=1 Tax=Marasmiellus scandens TaxID=2682957 RepID=A0ABR1JES7_9AGAR